MLIETTGKSFLRYFTGVSTGTEASASSTVKVPRFRPSQSVATFLRLFVLLIEKKCSKKNRVAGDNSVIDFGYLFRKIHTPKACDS
jgi:hypothetical protein